MKTVFYVRFFSAAKKAAIAVLLTAVFLAPLSAARIMENLNRGVVAVRINASSVYVGWRMLGTDPSGISFNVYRAGVKLNGTPITASTNYTDNTAANSTYTVRPVIGGVEQADSETASVWPQFYMQIPMTPPGMATMPDGTTCTYSANDCSTGDLDGDGEYEIIVKWDPSNAKDNSQSGYTGNVFLDAYKLNGTRLWRIDLGINIRAGAHYTQFMVYDLDSDGKAEVACKTAPNTRDSSGAFLSTGPANGDNDAADYRNSSGYILSGPEYLTVYNGQTGREIITVNYNPPRGTVSSWGDSYGNRVDRFLACIAYLDGTHPSLVMCRGYYTRATLAAWDFNGTQLTQRWFFDSNAAGNAAYAGEGNHNLSVGDVDNDGRDEIIYGSCAINDNGTGMYATGRGHGDACHLGDMDPDRAGLEWFQPHEEYPQAAGAEYRDPANGNLLWGYPNTADVGRGIAADIDGNYRGWEMWASNTDGVYNINGTRISTSKPSQNFRIYWDGDLQDELLDGTKLDKWNGNGTTRLVTIYNYATSTENNGTKANPGLTADILGDWREEMVYRSSDSTRLNIFTTTTMTNYRFYTLMHDEIYRLSVAWQNVAYNQPPHVSFYLADGPSAQPPADITYPGAPAGTPTRTWTVTRTATRTATATPLPAGYKEIQLEYPCSMNGIFENTNAGFTGDGYANLDNATGSAITFSLSSASAQYVSLSFVFANGSVNNRNMSVSVNGSVQVGNVDFLNTGAWTTWNTVSAGVNLLAGYNTITLTSLMAEGAPNLDKVFFVSTTISDGGCAAATFTPTGTFTRTATRTVTRTYTRTPTGTYTRTATPTATMTCTRTFTPTVTQTATTVINSPTPFTPSQTPTNSRTQTYTATGTSTGTNTPVPTMTNTGTPTRTVTDSPTATGSPTFTRTPTNTPLPAGYKELQAEDACSYDGIFETLHAGYTGTGYANLENTTGSSLLFYVNSASAQAITLSFRYANGSANERDMDIRINGVVQAANLLFPSTGAWPAWNTSQISVNLLAGRNEIMITALTAEGGPNIDMISFASLTASFDACVPSPTLTPVLTATGTETNEPTFTITMTETAIPTVTSTSSAVPTSTRTPTSTSTSTSTSSVQPTSTSSVQPTSTSSVQPTSTSSVQPTVTATAVITATSSVTATSTGTVMPSVTFTFTNISTPSETSTAVQTSTATITITYNITSTNTPYLSPTNTYTGTPPTDTNTPTVTSTFTAFPTGTFTRTNTATPSASMTVTPTATLSASPTGTNTGTPTALPTGTFTMTFTRTITVSPSATVTPSFTVTRTSTQNPTASPTFTHTADMSGALELNDAVIAPNPYNADGSDMKARLEMRGMADKIKICVYTASFRKVAEETATGSFYNYGIVSIPSRRISSLANGTYYVLITAENSSAEKAVCRIKTLIILR